MIETLLSSRLTEEQFAEAIEQLAQAPDRDSALVALLAEEHPVYQEKSAQEVVRMRGWVLYQLSLAPLPEAALVLVLEELETGTDAYSVAAAARALRSYSKPTSAFGPYVLRGIQSIRYKDEPVTFTAYGAFAMGSNCQSAMSDLLHTLAWLGPLASAVARPLQGILAEARGWSRALRSEAEQTLALIRGGEPASVEPLDAVEHSDVPADNQSDCCELPALWRGRIKWPLAQRPDQDEVSSLEFEDHTGRVATYAALTQGKPTIIVFFYTRCDNPLKCALTISKLKQMQASLRQQNRSEQIRTLAITYDAAYDTAPRLARYVADRGLVLDDDHRVLRCLGDSQKLQRYFGLGVNFIDAIVNRHRIEVFVSNVRGEITSSFQRLHWDTDEVLDSAIAELDVGHNKTPKRRAGVASLALTPIVPFLIAFFPKCPMCWAAYLSIFGAVGLEQIPYLPWMKELLIGLMMINLVCLWFRAKATNRMLAFGFAIAGACTVLASVLLNGTAVIWAGISLSMIGAFWCALPKRFSHVATPTRLLRIAAAKGTP